MRKDWKESQQMTIKNNPNINRENVLIEHGNKYHSGRIINSDDEIYYGFLYLYENHYELIIFHLDEYDTIYKHSSSDKDEISNIPYVEYAYLTDKHYLTKMRDNAITYLSDILKLPLNENIEIYSERLKTVLEFNRKIEENK